MLASNVTAETLQLAAANIGVRVDLHTLNAKGTRHRVKVSPVLPASARATCRACKGTGRSDAAGKSPAELSRLVFHPCPDCQGSGRSWRRRRGPAGDAPYQRLSAGYGRALEARVAAVCWHGFRDYFRAVYQLEPAARFQTALDTWQNSEDFEARFRSSGHRNIGSQACPVLACEACRCPDAGLAE